MAARHRRADGPGDRRLAPLPRRQRCTPARRVHALRRADRRRLRLCRSRRGGGRRRGRGPARALGGLASPGSTQRDRRLRHAGGSLGRPIRQPCAADQPAPPGSRATSHGGRERALPAPRRSPAGRGSAASGSAEGRRPVRRRPLAACRLGCGRDARARRVRGPDLAWPHLRG